MDFGGQDRRRQGDIFQLAVVVTFRKTKRGQTLSPLALEGANALVPGLCRTHLPGHVANDHHLEVADGLELAKEFL